MEENTTPPQVEASPVKDSLAEPVRQPQDKQTPPDPGKPKSKLKLPVIIVAVVGGILGLLIIAFFALNAYIRNEELKPNEPITASQKPSPTPNPTASWKTYTSNNIGVSFKLPEESEIYEDTSSQLSTIGQSLKYVFIIRSEKDPSFTKYESLRACDELSPPPCLTSGQKYGQTELLKKMMLGGINAVSYFTPSPSGRASPIHIIQTVESPFIEVEFPEPDSLHDQILSTFKFTNPDPTPTCMKRPACLDATPRCMIPEPANGWCP